ncbi:MAG: biotin/lipoyl-containing protein [Acidobacteriota bacterium]|nr:hypothetical protein [Blastocatellia bacterium]MDW8238140.1 biotin/lipoyl-containing protein [Acidobacteriota bacterium]
MKYEVDCHGETFTIELSGDSNRRTATINGETVEFDVSQPETGIYLVTINNRVIEVRTAGDPANGAIDVLVGGQKLSLRISDPRRKRRGGLTVTGTIQLKATMPGRVICWLCQPGDQITEGQGVLVLEAMKMQNEVRSPKAGVVKAINVSPDQTVEAGAVLAVIE